MTKRNKITIFFFAFLLISGLYVYFCLFKNASVTMSTNASVLTITSAQLIATYIKDEERADVMFREKVIEVRGIIKEISVLNHRNTVLLASDTPWSNVLCDMQADQINALKTLKKGQRIHVKGRCKGFLQDAVVLNCVLINTENK